MQSAYPETFLRDMACTPAEWQRWLPQAMGDCPWAPEPTEPGPLTGAGHPRESAVPGHLNPESALTAQVASGRLRLSWQVAEPRRLGLAVIPRLLVRFAFEGVSDGQRLVFMKRFDLYTQRGGG